MSAEASLLMMESPRHLANSVPALAVDGWLEMQASGMQQSWRDLLLANASLPPRVKHVLSPHDWSVALQAECLEAETELAQACDEFLRSGVILISEAPPPAMEVLLQSCEEAGWLVETRANGSVVAPLPSGRHIRLEISDGSMRGVIELGELAAESPPAKARELLLLTLAHEVRMVRPLLRQKGDRVVAELEVGFSACPDAETLGHALSALALAATLAAEVFDSFADENLASEFLAIRRPQSRSVATQTQEKQTP